MSTFPMWVAVASIALSAVACGPSDLPSGLPGAVEGTVDQNGGTLSFFNGLLVLVFPPDAVDQPVTFTATPEQDGAPTLVGNAYNLLPSMAFPVPVTVTVDYATAVLPTGVLENELGIYKEGNGWSEVTGSTVDVANDLVTVSVTSFSVYGLLGAPVIAVDISGPTNVDEGSTINLTGTTTDAAGDTLPARPIDWQSLTPQMATVDQSGAVNGISSGAAVIRASSEGVSDTVTIVVNDTGGSPPQVLASHNFDDQTTGPFTNPWGSARPWDFPPDPTSSGMGRVARTLFTPPSGQSQERGLAYQHPGIGVGDAEVWFKGDFYIDSTASTALDPDWTMVNARKLIDWQGSGQGRVFVMKYGTASSPLNVEFESCQNGSKQIIISDIVTSTSVSFNTWHTLEARYKPNSASGVTNGEFALYFDGALVYQRSTGLALAGSYNCGSSELNILMTGYQLTSNSGLPNFQEYRYWDNLTFSTARVP